MQPQDGSIMGPTPPGPAPAEASPKVQAGEKAAQSVPLAGVGREGRADVLTLAAWGVVPALVVGAAVAAWMWVWVNGKAGPRKKLDGEIATLRELQEMVRTLLAELDRRTAMLEETIHAADQRLQMLEEARDASAVEVRRQGVKREKVVNTERHPLSDRVVELSQRGASSIEIARELGCPTGQVELILALRRVVGGKDGQ